MPKILIDKSILINRNSSDLFKMLKDFNHWQAWSPWNIVENEARITVNADGNYYEWEGDIIGTGNMKIVDSIENERINYDLTFLKPWKSKAKISFVFKEEEEATRVHWMMESSMPFFLFFLKKMMEAFMGMDFERGLKMLKEYAETGVVNTKLTFKGFDDFKGCEYIGIKRECSFDEIDSFMQQDYTLLLNFMHSGDSDKIAGHAFSIYHKWDIVRGKVVYTACVPINAVPAHKPDRTIIGRVPATKVHVIHHKGPYEYVGNAWSAQYSRKQAKKFKLNKKVAPMEFYLNSPTNTEPHELESEIFMAVK